MLPEYLVTKMPVKEALDNLLAKEGYSKIGVLVDENTREHCYPLIKEVLPEHQVCLIQSGEINKTMDTCQIIWGWLTNHGFDRHSLLINLGGGVIGDMGGFCASTYKRGIAFVNIPTTLLSQVDASLGGKLGVDFGNYKNHIGLFRDPDQVIIDAVFLETLPAEEMKSGFAEVIKHCLIADAEEWKVLIHSDYQDLDWEEITEKSNHIKGEVVFKDPFEKGLRKILNFGHTLGHAIESYFLNTEKHLLHGEAIAIGMVLESYLSTIKTGLNRSEFEEIVKYIRAHYVMTRIEKTDIGSIMQNLVQDKKNQGGNLSFVLLKAIGKPNEVNLKEEEILKAMEFYSTIME